ncbi:MAG: DinB family protein [Planctomycetota bacterium]|nr:MAG: DinB family protein [Planctomycetota bacterium]
MDIKQGAKTSLAQADLVVNYYLQDLTDAELLARPLPDCNHIAWQLGHLISAERMMLEKLAPGKTEPLPEGFEAAHNKETAKIDDASKFRSKDEYLKLAAGVRAQTLSLLEAMSAEDFDRPLENAMPGVKVAGDLFFFISMHWLMHSGQWAIVRRSLGRPPLF